MSELAPQGSGLLEVLDAPLPRDRHPVGVYLARLGAGSRRAMASAISHVADILSGGRLDPWRLPWHQLQYQHTQAARAQLVDRYAPATANRHLAALRGVLKETWRLGLMEAETYHRAADLQTVKSEVLLTGRALNLRELQELFQACAKDPSPAGRRNAALLSLLAGCGLRRSEAVSLELADYSTETTELRVRDGKGRKQRLVYVPPGGRDALEAWLEARGDWAGPLLCPVSQIGQVRQRAMSGQAVLYALRKIAEYAQVKAFSPHDLRRTFISELLDAGAELVNVQKLAGHANPATTARYDRRGEMARKRTSELMQVPYVVPGG